MNVESKQRSLFDLLGDERLATPAPPERPQPSAALSGFVTESRAAQLFVEAAQLHRPGAVRAARVSFHPFRTTLYSFKIKRSEIAYLKFHVAFRRASETVVAQACAIMLCRSRGKKAAERREYDQFVRAMSPTDFELPGARRGRRLALSVPGKFHSLDESFDRVNATYFKSQLKKPELCWSPVRARRLLGSYHERKDRLIISQIFDAPKVPTFVLDFLMYHELLHKFLGIGARSNGKRCIHGRDFNELEKKFARFKEAQAFLKKL